MKYLKMFNENISTEEIEKYCKDSLSYLLDENPNLQIEIDDTMISCDIYQFSLKVKSGANNKFYWKDIKDEFIPFLEMFNKRYTILNGSNDDDDNEIPKVSFHVVNQFKSIDYSLDDVLSNNDIGRIGLRSIKFYFETK